MGKRIKIGLLIITASLGIYQMSIKAYSMEGYEILNVHIYRNTLAWELALAVRGQNTNKIEKIIKNKPALLNYQDPKYGATLLLWAVGTEKYKAAEALLRCGADPDIASNDKTTWGGQTPLFVAAGYSWVDRHAKKDPKYVKLLLSYNADPDLCYSGFNISVGKSMIEVGRSPLMQSIGCGIEKTKALVEAGADVNYLTKSGDTAAIKALLAGWNSTLEYLHYAHYLIVEKKAKVNEPYFRGERMTLPGQNPNDKFYPVDILRDWIYPLDSKEYQIKMEIVEEFAWQGVNYWETKINKFTLGIIKKRYPDTWEEYIKKY